MQAIPPPCGTCTLHGAQIRDRQNTVPKEQQLKTSITLSQMALPG